MTIFSRYVFRQAAGAVLLILLSLSGIVWIALALKQLNVVTGQGQSTWTLFKMTTMALPNLMALIAPVALLIAALHTLNRLNSDSELIVVTAAGVPAARLMRPLLLLAGLVMLGVALVNHIAQPWSLRQLREYMMQARTDLLTQVIQPGRFSSPEPNLTFHIRERTLDGELLGLIMHDTRTQGEAQSYLAERGRIIKQDETAYLMMSEGHVVRRSKPEDPAQIIAFEKYAVDLDRFEAKAGEVVELRPRERYFSELVWPDKSGAYFKAQHGMFGVELHERFSNPLYPLAFVMIALAAAGRAQSTRQARVARMVWAFLAGAGLRLVGLAVNNLAVKNPTVIPLLYVLPLSACAISFAMLRRQGPSRFGRAAQRAAVAWWAPIATSAPARALKRRFDALIGGAAA